MSHSQQLYHTISHRLQEGLPHERITRLRNVSLWSCPCSLRIMETDLSRDTNVA
jgi:hypothetical protein